MLRIAVQVVLLCNFFAIAAAYFWVMAYNYMPTTLLWIVSLVVGLFINAILLLTCSRELRKQGSTDIPTWQSLLLVAYAILHAQLGYHGFYWAQTRADAFELTPLTGIGQGTGKAVFWYADTVQHDAAAKTCIESGFIRISNKVSNPSGYHTCFIPLYDGRKQLLGWICARSNSTTSKAGSQETANKSIYGLVMDMQKRKGRQYFIYAPLAYDEAQNFNVDADLLPEITQYIGGRQRILVPIESPKIYQNARWSNIITNFFLINIVGILAAMIAYARGK